MKYFTMISLMFLVNCKQISDKYDNHSSNESLNGDLLREPASDIPIEIPSVPDDDPGATPIDPHLPDQPLPTDTVNTDDCGTDWYTANLTNYISYPEPGSDECVLYNGCKWQGQFAGVSGVKSESWVMNHNIVAVHSKDWNWLDGKTLKLKQDDKQIDVVVYDLCDDSDCDGCCSANLGGDGFLIDIEKYTMQRFGSGEGTVQWQVCE